MAVKEMQKAIARIRLFLAELGQKETELADLRRQFEQQMRRTPAYAVYSGAPLEASLNAMSEIQERLDQVKITQEHLTAIKERAENELNALQITLKVEQAKGEIAALQEKLSTAGKEKGAIEEEIRRLKDFVSRSSIRAGETIRESADKRAQT